MNAQATSSPAAQHPAQTAPAAHRQEPIKRWSYPFELSSGRPTTDPQAFLSALGGAKGGFFPMGINGLPHGGVHFDGATASELQQDKGIRVLADGEVVAYLLDSTYPRLKYADGKWALYSRSFVLVRQIIEAPADPTAPDAPRQTQTLFNLYMHLMDYKGYQDAEKEAGSDDAKNAAKPLIHRMPYWIGTKAFKVGDKAKDKQSRPAYSTEDKAALKDPLGALIGTLDHPEAEREREQAHLQELTEEAAQAPQTGLHIRSAPSGTVLGLLPRGAKVTLSETVTSDGWAQILSIRSGEPIGKTVGHPPAQGAAQGWVYVAELDSLIEPNPLDSVVVLDKPYPVKAGDVIGYLGHYQNHSDVFGLPPVPNRPIVHMEVFADTSLPAFIAKCRQVAAKLPADQKTVMLLRKGTTPLGWPKPDQKLPTGTRLKETKDSPQAGRYAKVQTLAASMQPAHGHHPAKEVLTPQGDPLWVERYTLTNDHSERDAWKSFPLSASSTPKNPAATFEATYTRSVLNAKASDSRARDDQGTNWWFVEYGTDDGGSKGWVSEKDYPGTEWVSPWAWPGFEIVDSTGLELVNIAKRFDYILERIAESDDKQSFKSAAAAVNGSKYITKLEDMLDADHDGTITALELSRALKLSWKAKVVSKVILRYESEWGGSMAKWDAISSIVGVAKFQWQGELERIEKLRFWDKVQGVKDFPNDPKVYHIHPIGLVGNFIGSGLTMEEARVRAFLRMIRIGEGTQGYSGYEYLYSGKSFIRDFHKTFDDHPRIMITANGYSSTAAGAYQVMGYTWDDASQIALRQKYHITDFSPASQDRYAVLILKYKRKALGLIKDGRIQEAIEKCNAEWTSLPGSAAGQPTVALSRALDGYQKFLNDELGGQSDLASPQGSLQDLLD